MTNVVDFTAVLNAHRAAQGARLIGRALAPHPEWLARIRAALEDALPPKTNQFNSPR